MAELPQLPNDQYMHISPTGLESILKSYSNEVPQRNFFWTTDYRQELPVRIKKQGFGSEEPYTMVEMFKRSCEKFGPNAALNYERQPNKWITITYKEYYVECTKFANALISLGIPSFTATNIIGFNSPEWAISFYGSLLGHYLPVGMYTTNGPDACEYVTNHSEAQVVILENVIHLNKYIKVKEKVKGVKYFILYKDQVPKDLPEEFKGKVMHWKDLLELGAKFKPAKLQDTLEYRQSLIKAGHCCTFIYTSGTTGPPKAVMQSHDGYTWTADAIGRRVGLETDSLQGKGRILSYLPLNHAAGQMLDLVFGVRFGFSVFFPDASALQGNLVKFLLIARPTWFLGVPRVWQKIEDKLTQALSKMTGFKKSVADWAREKALEGTYAQMNGKPLPAYWSIAKKLFFNKIKEGLGFDQVELFLFGAAPLKQSSRQFFLSLNIFLRNGYGMSELSAVESVTQPSAFSTFNDHGFLKQAGKAFQGLQMIIYNPDKQGNGEVCHRGRNCFMGYYKNEKETRETIDKKGFVHSGDVGFINKQGVLYITGRIKELIITAGGQNIAPVLIENEISEALSIVATPVVIGDKMKYLTALITLKLKDGNLLADEVVELLQKEGSKAKTVKEAATCPIARKFVEKGIAKANEKAISNAHKIQKFTILPHQFTMDSGVLTPTMKLKRKVCSAMYAKEIEAMYIDAKL